MLVFGVAVGITVVGALLIIAALLADAPVAARGGVAVVGLVAPAPAWRFALSGLRFEADSVVVMNPLATVRLPRRSVERFEVQTCEIGPARVDAVVMCCNVRTGEPFRSGRSLGTRYSSSDRRHRRPPLTASTGC